TTHNRNSQRSACRQISAWVKSDYGSLIGLRIPASSRTSGRHYSEVGISASAQETKTSINIESAITVAETKMASTSARAKSCTKPARAAFLITSINIVAKAFRSCAASAAASAPPAVRISTHLSLIAAMYFLRVGEIRFQNLANSATISIHSVFQTER